MDTSLHALDMATLAEPLDTGNKSDAQMRELTRLREDTARIEMLNRLLTLTCRPQEPLLTEADDLRGDRAALETALRSIHAELREMLAIAKARATIRHVVTTRHDWRTARAVWTHCQQHPDDRVDAIHDAARQNWRAAREAYEAACHAAHMAPEPEDE